MRDRPACRCSTIQIRVIFAGVFVSLVVFVAIICGIVARQFTSDPADSVCPHGHFIVEDRTVCCPSVSLCSHGVHTDEHGCLQCCDPYNQMECETNGYYFNGTSGCRVCCEQDPSRCRNGFQRDSYGCARCCDVPQYTACEYGSYNEASGCKRCCSPYIATDCLKYGHRLDAAGCKFCCSSYNETGCGCDVISCPNGYRNDGSKCRTCCSQNEEACLHGFFSDFHGCSVCCQDPGKCMYGYLNDSNGCRQCCPSGDNFYLDCVSYGMYKDEDREGCYKCCGYYSSGLCMTNGFYSDSRGCKKCCEVEKSSCELGYNEDSNRCAVCCSNPGNCSHSYMDVDAS